MRILSFLLFTMIFLSCKKNHGSTVTEPVIPPVVLPSAPDTLGAGWVKVGQIPIAETVSDIVFTDELNGYITTTAGIYKSSNGGIDWVKINSDIDFINITANGSRACFVNSSYTLYHTQDHGQTIQATSYQNSSPNGGPGFKDCFYVDNNLCFASSNQYIWKSVDGGITFDTIYNFNDNAQTASSLVFTSAQDGWILRNYHVYKTTDGGVHWEIKEDLNDQSGPIFFLDPSSAYIGNTRSLYNSSDGGTSWNYVCAFDASLTDIQFVDGTNQYCVAGTRVYKKDITGINWTPVISLGEKLISEIFFLDEHHGWACGQYGYVLRFTL